MMEHAIVPIRYLKYLYNLRYDSAEHMRIKGGFGGAI